MFNWNTQQNLINIHDYFHLNPVETLNLSPTFDLFLDSSCTFCYTPPLLENCTNQFIFFWNWFSLNNSATSFSRKTIETFNLLLNSNLQIVRTTYLDLLFESIRFDNFEDRDLLLDLTLNCLDYTQGFTIHQELLNNLPDLENYTTSDSTILESEDSSDSEPEVQNNTNNNNMNQQQAFTQAINALTNQLAIRNNVQMPIFIGGIQDSVE